MLADAGVAKSTILLSRLWVDAVEKGIFRTLKATLIQDWRPMRNLDSKTHLPEFVCFKFQFHISFAETFSTVSVISGHTPSIMPRN
jgi:hypothetical protein